MRTTTNRLISSAVLSVLLIFGCLAIATPSSADTGLSATPPSSVPGSGWFHRGWPLAIGTRTPLILEESWIRVTGPDGKEHVIHPHSSSDSYRIAGEVAGLTTATWNLVNTGGQSVSGSASFMVDPTPPEVVITSPREREQILLGSKVDVVFSCVDPDMTILLCYTLDRDGNRATSGTLETSRLGLTCITVTVQSEPSHWGRVLQSCWTVVSVLDPDDDPEPPEGLVTLESATIDEQEYPSGTWTELPSDAPADTGVVDGSPVVVNAQVQNIGGKLRSTTMVVIDQETNARLGPPVTFDLGPGGTAERALPIDTQGLAWNANGTPRTRPYRLAIEIDGERWDSPRYLRVLPRPVILVHGYKSSAGSSWGAYQSILATGHPLLRGYAVGDGQGPGAMSTGDENRLTDRTNTIAENAAVEAAYIDAIRDKTDAWHVDIVAHSMGGLISRYYIQELMPEDPPDERPVVNRLIQLGTPNMGSEWADLLLAIGHVDPKAIPLYPATLQLSTGYVAEIFNGLVNDFRGVPVSNLVGTEIPMALMPINPRLFGDGVVPAYSARWNLQDTFDQPGDFHTAMTESLDDFEEYVLPRLNGTEVAVPGAAPETTVVRTDSSTGARAASAWAEGEGPSAFAGSAVSVPAGGSTSVDLDVPAGSAFGVVTGVTGVDLELVDPDGRVAARNDADAALPLTVATVDGHAAGSWKLRITNPGGTAVEVPHLAWVAGGELTLDVAAEPLAGGRTRLRATVRDAGNPGVDGKVTATIIDGDDEQVVTLVDDGTGPDTVRDGVYTGVVPALTPGRDALAAVRLEGPAGSRLATTALPDATRATPRSIEVTVLSDASGSATADPEGPRYLDGQEVTLTAHPVDGWHHVGWLVDGDRHPAGPYTFTVTQEVTIVPLFEEGDAQTAPTVEVGAVDAVEGERVRITGSFVDPDGDGWTATVDPGDGTGPQPATITGTAIAFDHTYVDDGTHTATISVDDGTAAGSGTATVTVANAAPVVSVDGAASQTVTSGTAVDLVSRYTDKGTADTHQGAVVVSGPASPAAPATVTRTGPGAGTVSTRVTFTTAGTYQVRTTVTDDEGAAGTATRTVVVTTAPTPAKTCTAALADFDRVVTSRKVPKASATPMRVALSTACTSADKGRRAEAALAVLAYKLLVGANQIGGRIDRTTANQLNAITAPIEAVIRR